MLVKLVLYVLCFLLSSEYKIEFIQDLVDEYNIYLFVGYQVGTLLQKDVSLLVSVIDALVWNCSPR